ncbi:regulatory protein SipA [Chroococcus sp. FPU101]|uniref:regulatory protein SipA n=1 Tax=Chroococcus sp. FPU101 TaxID=1974212 RepID=UPI001A8D187C|nr:DUF3148 domain-containing protein [Chroococcus sp. FPU101]GFE71042.1 hypothetical protein CFPU101_36520 [Chroococcus sp. FPU101]
MSETEIMIGGKVRLVVRPPYLKTAEPMPMLRPSDILELGDEGVVVERSPAGYWAVRFKRGAFLIESQYLEPVESHQELL